MASLRHRREVAEVEDYDGDVHDDGSRTAPDSATEEEEEEEEEEDHRQHLGLHSMTAKGIQHMCSELLEIKRASEQDFSGNVYLSYLSFIRMFQEAGDLDKDVHRLKRQVIAHRRLIQHLSSNSCCCCLYSSSSSPSIVPGLAEQPGSASGSKDKEAAVDIDATVIPDPADDHEEELELDVLLSEHRMDQALELLELQGQALQRMQQADEAEAIASSMRALSARQARVADRFASVADNPRTPRPELLKALSGLCKLGDAQRANHLLFRFYRASAVRGVEELRASQARSSSSNYIKDLAHMVFSCILQASRSFVALHGHPSPHTPQLVRWAREEMEDLSVAFSEYVTSVSQQPGRSLALALEAAECALSYSSLLRPLDIVSEQDVIDLIVPCVREVLTMYARHLREVIRLFVASDAWVLGRFLMSGMLSSHAAAAGLQVEHCLLTASGRKFLTLIQEVMEDLVCPLSNLGMDDSVLQLVAELFREYMHSIVELIPRFIQEAALQNGNNESTKGQQYMWQLSILVNCTTLVSLFPVIAHGVFKTSSDEARSLPDFSTQREVDNLISLIKEAAGQVWTCFCQQFIRDTMSATASFAEGIPSSPPQGMIPSFTFQVLFLRVRQLQSLYGTMLTGKDGTMKTLLQELMEAMIFWLSSNLDSWIHHAQGVPRDTTFQQVQLDVHFLLELSQLGGFSCENITTSALDLLRKAEEKVAPLEQDGSGIIREEDWGWAAAAAKHAVEALLLMGTEANILENVVDAGEEFDQGSVASSGQKETLDTTCNSVVEAPEDGSDGGGKSSDEFISIEDDDEDGIMSLSSEKMKLKLGLLGSSSQAAPGYSDEINGEEEHHPEPAEVEKDQSDDNVRGDDEIQAEEGMCHDAIEDLVGGDHDDSSCEEMHGGGGQSRRRRQAARPAAAAAEKGTVDPSRRSRKKREAVSRSSRPRWQ